MKTTLTTFHGGQHARRFKSVAWLRGARKKLFRLFPKELTGKFVGNFAGSVPTGNVPTGFREDREISFFIDDFTSDLWYNIPRPGRDVGAI